jgi:hypothetical protein
VGAFGFALLLRGFVSWRNCFVFVKVW